MESHEETDESEEEAEESKEESEGAGELSTELWWQPGLFPSLRFVARDSDIVPVCEKQAYSLKYV